MAIHSKGLVLATIETDGVIPLCYSDELGLLCNVARAIVGGGLNLLEVTNRGDGASEVFAELLRWSRYEFPQLIVGMGSVVDASTAGRALDAGASFIVSPCLCQDVAEVCNARNVPYLPGCGTVTEIQAAYRLGADIVKLFPAGSIGGPAFLSAVRAPCPWIRAVPTGGVAPTAESIRPWFRAGAPAVGMGSQLLPSATIAAGDTQGLKRRISDAVAAVAQARIQDEK